MGEGARQSRAWDAGTAPRGLNASEKSIPVRDHGLEGATQPLFLPTSPGHAVPPGIARRGGGDGRAEGGAALGQSNGLQHII